MLRAQVLGLTAGLSVAMFCAAPASANEAIIEDLKNRISEEYDLTWFTEGMEVSISKRRVSVSADGENVDLSQTYLRDGDMLGELVEQDFSTSDDADIARAVLGEEQYASLMKGRVPGDVSFDRSCDGDECDFSFDASGPGFDLSFDGDCDASGCEYSFDSSVDRAEAEREWAEEEADREADRREEEADREADRREAAADREADRREAERDYD